MNREQFAVSVIGNVLSLNSVLLFWRDAHMNGLYSKETVIEMMTREREKYEKRTSELLDELLKEEAKDE